MIKYVIALIFAFFLPNVASLGLGHILVRTDCYHQVGVRLLAQSMLCRPRVIASKCQQNCSATKCGNWTCENYHHSGK